VAPYEIEVTLSAAAVMAWLPSELAPFGLAIALPFQAPEGMRRVGERRFEETRTPGEVQEVFDVEELPPPPPEPTPVEKVERLAADYGLTIDDLKRVVAGDKIGAAEAVEIASKV